MDHKTADGSIMTPENIGPADMSAPHRPHRTTGNNHILSAEVGVSAQEMPSLLSPRAVYFSAATSRIYMSSRRYIMSASSPTKIASMTPRPSASLVVVNERNEILLVHRNPRASSFGGMHVRPFGMSVEQTFPKLTGITHFRRSG